jgi:2-oxoglutarate dehydrogenase E2 component (dihydrolipoamide succinyltransferase)
VADPVLGEVIAVRSTAYLSLSYDHRIVDAADAGAGTLSLTELSRNVGASPSGLPLEGSRRGRAATKA